MRFTVTATLLLAGSSTAACGNSNVLSIHAVGFGLLSVNGDTVFRAQPPITITLVATASRNEHYNTLGEQGTEAVALKLIAVSTTLEASSPCTIDTPFDCSSGDHCRAQLTITGSGLCAFRAHARVTDDGADGCFFEAASQDVHDRGSPLTVSRAFCPAENATCPHLIDAGFAYCRG